MGLMDQIRRFNTTEKGLQFINLKGRPFAPFTVKEAVFYEATKDHPNVNYLFGTTIEKVVSNNDNTVKVELSHGEVQECDLLVAADGQWSNMRKQCFPSDYVNVVHLDMYVAYWTIPRLLSDNNWWNIYLAFESRLISLRPDPHGPIRAMFTHMPCNDAQEMAWLEASKSDRQTQEELLRREFAGAGWQAQRLLDAMP
ncbi:hypothetical protein MMC06_006503 [Schaereria dolodes]|nr:hypothetical protein [Schaereria dolodes]